jgi:hypothetical protein
MNNLKTDSHWVNNEIEERSKKMISFNLYTREFTSQYFHLLKPRLVFNSIKSFVLF